MWCSCFAQDDSLAEAMSEGDAAADVGHQSGYMLEDSPEIDDVPMEEDKQTHESPERQSDDVDRGSSLSHPLNSLRGPKQKQATKDVNALHDVRNPEFFAAAQQQSKVKEGDWAEVKLGESDGSGNVVVID